MRLVDRADERVVLLNRRRDQVDVDFQARGQHLARVAMAGMIVHHEILREELQHHAVFLQLHARGALDHALHVALLESPARTQVPARRGRWRRARSGRPCRRPPIPPRRRGRRFGFAQRRQDGFGDRLLIGDPAFDPALRFHRARPDQADAAVLQNADHQPRLAAARVESYCVNRFYCH